MDEWLKIIGALGGLEAIRFTVTFLANRKTNARKEKATADSMELQNLLSIIDNLNKQIERYDERLKQRDEKVDTIYREWRTAQAEAQNWMRKYYELELALKDAYVKNLSAAFPLMMYSAHTMRKIRLQFPYYTKP